MSTVSETPEKPRTGSFTSSAKASGLMVELENHPEAKSLPGVDLDKLAKAVAMHETANCTKGSARFNNCFGIKYAGKFARYATKEASYADFKRIWSKPTGYYRGQFPTLALAKKYSGNDRASIWLKNVSHFYSSL